MRCVWTETGDLRITVNGETLLLDACGAASFVPTGPCHAEIRAGEPTAMTNADALQQLFDFTTATGAAFTILNDVNGNIPECKSVCTPD